MHYLENNIKKLNLNLIYTIFSILDILDNSIRFLILKSKIELDRVESISK